MAGQSEYVYVGLMVVRVTKVGLQLYELGLSSVIELPR